MIENICNKKKSDFDSPFWLLGGGQWTNGPIDQPHSPLHQQLQFIIDVRFSFHDMYFNAIFCDNVILESQMIFKYFEKSDLFLFLLLLLHHQLHFIIDLRFSFHDMYFNAIFVIYVILESHMVYHYIHIF